MTPSLFLVGLLLTLRQEPSPALRVEITRYTQVAGQPVQKKFVFRAGEAGLGERPIRDIAPAGGPHRNLKRIVSACGPAIAEDGEAFVSVRMHAYVYDNPRDVKFEVGVFNDRLQRAQGDVVASWKVLVFGKPMVQRGPTRLYDGTGRWELPLGPLRLAPQDARFHEYAREVPELPLSDADVDRLIGRASVEPIAVAAAAPSTTDTIITDQEIVPPALALFIKGANRGQELYLSALRQKLDRDLKQYTVLEPALAPIQAHDTFTVRDAEDPDPALTGGYRRNGFWSVRANAIVLRTDRADEIVRDLLAFVYVQARRPYHYADDQGEVFRYDRDYPVDPGFTDGTPRRPLFEKGRPQLRSYRETFGRASYDSAANPWQGYLDQQPAVQEQACAVMLSGSEAARYDLECLVETLGASVAMALYPKGPCPADLDAAWLLEAFDFANFALADPRYVKAAESIVQALEQQHGENYLVLYAEDQKLKEPNVNSVDAALLIGALYRHWRWGGSPRALNLAKAFVPAWLKHSPITTDDNGDGEPDRLIGWKARWSAEHPSRFYLGTNPLAVAPSLLVGLQYALDFSDDARARFCRDRLIEILLRTRVNDESQLSPTGVTTHAFAAWALKNYGKRFAPK